MTDLNVNGESSYIYAYRSLAHLTTAFLFLFFPPPYFLTKFTVYLTMLYPSLCLWPWDSPSMSSFPQLESGGNNLLCISMVRTSHIRTFGYKTLTEPQRFTRLTTASLGSPLPSRVSHSSLDHTAGEDWDLKTGFLQTSLREGGNAPFSSASKQLCCASSACVSLAARLHYCWALPSTYPSCGQCLCPAAASGTQHTHCQGACPKTKKPPHERFHSAFGEKQTEAVDLHALHLWTPFTSKSHTQTPLGTQVLHQRYKLMVSSWLSSWNCCHLFN